MSPVGYGYYGILTEQFIDLHLDFSQTLIEGAAVLKRILIVLVIVGIVVTACGEAEFGRDDYYIPVNFNDETDIFLSELAPWHKRWRSEWHWNNRADLFDGTWAETIDELLEELNDFDPPSSLSREFFVYKSVIVNQVNVERVASLVQAKLEVSSPFPRLNSESHNMKLEAEVIVGVTLNYWENAFFDRYGDNFYEIR